MNCAAPQDIKAAVSDAIRATSALSPLVLIDVKTGRLCNALERERIFKSEKPYSDLFPDVQTTATDKEKIERSVKKYFAWVMFSHTWEGEEPTFANVKSAGSVWGLDDSPLNEKLCEFCATVSAEGYRWAWSDTCCIDKGESAVMSESIISMYSWYANAAETFVYLADVVPDPELDPFKRTRWMTRAWTLQELLASKVIRFYNKFWKPYRSITTNHKESSSIMEELARAMGVAPEIISRFRPGNVATREILRIASTREATRQEDIAYSLIGVFSSDIVPRYGLGKAALGNLLESIVARSGDMTVIMWTGKSSQYNTALPASLRVYGEDLCPPPSSHLDMQVNQLRGRSVPTDFLAFYDQVMELPRPTFSNRRLHLPCITFSVTQMEIPSDRQEKFYRAKVSMLENVEFRTTDELPKKPRKHQLIFVHPWIRDLIGSPERLVQSIPDTDEENEMETKTEQEQEQEQEQDVELEDESTQDKRNMQTLRLIARLGCSFNALLLVQQPNGQYKRVAADHKFNLSGFPYQGNLELTGIRAKVVEIM